ncbi:hypothetical protein P4B35_23110 [Pontiellaceae bacterium B12227]|nr:hypothetical protein [Pontiellaceae bacterium B12227]
MEKRTNMLWMLWMVGAAVLTTLPAPAVSESKIPQALKAERPGEWWVQRHDEKVAAAKKGRIDLVLIGDTIRSLRNSIRDLKGTVLQADNFYLNLFRQGGAF